ncbi:hypothetical protein ACFL4L_07795 [bacterium]
MIVGGYALAFHGVPRYTGDIDIYVKPDIQNASKIMRALEAFGFGAVGIEQKDLETPDKVIQLGIPPVRIDIITSITGVTWDEANSHCVEGKYGETRVRYIGLQAFITNKRATGRKRDLSDLESIGEE